MGGRRIVGVILIVVGIFALVWGGVFWTERDTVIDVGPLEVQTERQEGVSLPPILGIIALIGGIVLVAIPDRSRV